MDEQKALFHTVEKTTRDLVQLVTRLGDEVRLISEYRTRLIADVVTGKLDVRAAAARLPDETDEPDTADDDLLDSDEMIEDAEFDAEPEEVDA